MKKIFTLLGGLIVASSLTLKAEEVTVYISDADGNEIAEYFDADLTKDADGVYTLTNLFGVDEGYGIPFSFKFAQPKVGNSTAIEVTSNTSAVSDREGCYYIKNSNDKYPIFWLWDLNGNNDWARLRKSYIDLGNGESYVYRYDTSDSENEYEYVATLKISGTFNGYNEETESYDKELFTGEGETAPWLYLEFWFNDPEGEGDNPGVEVLQTIPLTVYVDDAYYYPNYKDYNTYSDKSIKSFDSELDVMSDGSYTLKNIFGSGYSISYTASTFNPKGIAKVSYTGNIYTESGYEDYPYFLNPTGNYMTVTVEEESGEKMEVEYFSGDQSTDSSGSPYSSIQKCTTAQIEAGYDEYYVDLSVNGYVGDTGYIDMYLSFSYNLTTTGVANVESNENAPVEFYNLQGVKVADPSNGIFIRRQGNKTSKVIVK